MGISKFAANLENSAVATGLEKVSFHSDPLEKEMATHSSILAWRIPWTEEPGELQSTGYKESDTTEQLTAHRDGEGVAGTL